MLSGYRWTVVMESMWTKCGSVTWVVIPLKLMIHLLDSMLFVKESKARCTMSLGEDVNNMILGSDVVDT